MTCKSTVGILQYNSGWSEIRQHKWLYVSAQSYFYRNLFLLDTSYGIRNSARVKNVRTYEGG